MSEKAAEERHLLQGADERKVFAAHLAKMRRLKREGVHW